PPAPAGTAGAHLVRRSFPPRRASDLGGLDIMQAVLRRGGSDIEMTPLSRSDYRIIVDKDQKGRPDRYFVDRQSSTPTVYFWQAADRKSTRLNSSHVKSSYAVFCLKKK